MTVPASLPAAPLRVALLGPPEATWAGQPLVIARRQTRALLYRLAADVRPIPREQLCYLFWPDLPDDEARRALTRLLTHLRRALPEPDVLAAGGDQLGLRPERVWSDVAAVARTAAGPDPLRRDEALRLAVDLYRGPFLDGFALPDSPEFEDWSAGERQRWERRHLEALGALVEAQTARGEYEAAIASAQRALAADELAEAIHRRLIALYAAVGDRGAAVRQFERCAAVLERELGRRPHARDPRHPRGRARGSAAAAAAAGR